MIATSESPREPFASIWEASQRRIAEARDTNATMLAKCDTSGRPLYRVTSSGNLRRTMPVAARVKRSILDRDGHACVPCGSASDLEIDHIVRYADGGGNDPSNLRTLCHPCHVRRSGK